MQELNTRVNYWTKCKCCGEKQSFIMRDTNVNQSLSDTDIYKIIANNKYGQDFLWCVQCQMMTLQERVAYDYTNDYTKKNETRMAS